MSDTVITARLQLLAKTYAQWASTNPVLLDGEWAVVRIPGTPPAYKIKIGDGETPFTALPYGIWSGEKGNDGVDGSKIVPSGEWNAGTAYTVDNGFPLVSYADKSWLARRASTGANPETSPNDWQLFVNMAGIAFDEPVVFPELEIKVASGAIYYRAKNHPTGRFMDLNPKVAVVRYVKQQAINASPKHSKRKSKRGYVVTGKFAPVNFLGNRNNVGGVIHDVGWEFLCTLESLTSCFITRDNSGNCTLKRRSKRRLYKNENASDFYMSILGGFVLMCDNPVFPFAGNGAVWGHNKLIGTPVYATIGRKRIYFRQIGSQITNTRLQDFCNLAYGRRHKL